MDYGSIVKAAWANDPTFVELCKTLWGPAVTPDEVVAISKDGPDASSVHVPGSGAKRHSGKCKCSTCIPLLDNRGIAKVHDSYAQVPKAQRDYKRDGQGRFSSVGEIASNATVAGVTGIGAGVGLNHARGDAGKLGRLISELKSTPEGRAKLLRVIGTRGTRLGALAGASMIVGAAAGHHGKEAYEGIKDHVDLEREHARHVVASVRGDDTRSFVQNNQPHDLHVRTRGARRDAVTNVFARDAAEGHVDLHYRDTNEYRRRQEDAEREAHRRSFASFGKSVTGSLTQVDEDKRQVFGWASIVEKNGLPVVDLQGDYITIDELEKAAYDYVHKSRVGGAMHRRVDADGNVIEKADRPYHAADLIESFVVTHDKIEKMGLPGDTPVGWWVGFKVNDDDVWSSVKNGDWKGFSIHGAGRRRAFEVTGAELTAA